MTLFDEHPADERAKRARAVDAVRGHFSAGLADLCDPRFLAARYAEFLRRDDPIYVELLQGMGDKPLSRTFVSYWTIAQTLATRSRFWLEDAVAEIITGQVRRFGRPATIADGLAAFDEFLRRGRRLDAILVTHSGKPNEAPVGIVTIHDIPALRRAVRE